MSAASVIRFRIWKCVHGLARNPRGGLFRPVFDLGRVRKQNKRTTETGLTKWIFYEEVHVSFGWLTRLRSPFLKILRADISKNFKFFEFFNPQPQKALCEHEKTGPDNAAL